jgi:hypothetical protein
MGAEPLKMRSAARQAWRAACGFVPALAEFTGHQGCRITQLRGVRT